MLRMDTRVGGVRGYSFFCCCLFVCSYSQPLGPLEVDQPDTALERNLVEGFVRQECLVGGSNDVVVVPASMGLGDDVRDPHELEDFATQGISAQSVGGRSQDDLARVLASHQIPRQGSSPVPIDKENIALGHAAGNLDGILRLEGLSQTKPSASAKVAANDKGPEGDDTSTPPHFANAIGSNEHLSPGFVNFGIDSIGGDGKEEREKPTICNFEIATTRKKTSEKYKSSQKEERHPKTLEM